MQLSVVILNYNVRYFLELCLKSVRAALTNIDAEIIVVDNCSSDDSCAMVRQHFPEVKLIVNDMNFGFSKGNNIGVAEAKGQYVCILNPDTVVAEDTFHKLLKLAESEENLGITSCRLIDGKGTFLPESKRQIPIPKIAIKKILGMSQSYYVSSLNETETGPVPIFVGAFMLMKRSVYTKVKGFDEDYFMYGEDIDLSYKVLKAGYNNLYHGDVSVVHFKGESTLKDKTYAKRFYGAMQIFYDKHFKSNIFFDLMVWLGTRLMPLLQNKGHHNGNVSPKRYVLISDKDQIGVSKVLKSELSVQSSLDQYDNNTQYVLDNNYLSFKSIITILSNAPKNCSATFKILPKKSNFIIGSDSSKSRGEVLLF